MRRVSSAEAIRETNWNRGGLEWVPKIIQQNCPTPREAKPGRDSRLDRTRTLAEQHLARYAVGPRGRVLTAPVKVDVMCEKIKETNGKVNIH